MRKPFKTIGPKGDQVYASQLDVGDVTQAGDWFLELSHYKQKWHSAEPNLKIKEFHLPHVRIIENK